MRVIFSMPPTSPAVVLLRITIYPLALMGYLECKPSMAACSCAVIDGMEITQNDLLETKWQTGGQTNDGHGNLI